LYEADALKFVFDPGAVSYINNGQNFGIGDPTPGAKLEILDGITFGLRFGANAAGNGYNIFDVNDNLFVSSNRHVSIVLDNNNDQTGAVFSVLHNGQSGSELFRVQDNGNVGIGTTNPDEELHVTGGAATSPGIVVEEISTAGDPHYDWRINGIDVAIAYVDNSENDAWKLQVGSTMAINVESGGNVGIGTTGPDAKLDVAGGINVGNNDRVQLWECAAGGGCIAIDNSAGTRVIQLRGDTGVNYINNGQNFGIGDSSPAYRLEIGGGDVNTVAGGYRDAGTCVAGSCASDIRLKKNVKPVENALSKVEKLNPVTFEFINEKYGPGQQYGLIAQEVEKILPELVKENNGYKSVSYGLEIEMLLLKSIKEMANEIEQLQEENKEIELLKQRIENLENKK